MAKDEKVEEVEVGVPSAHQKYLEEVTDPDREVPVFGASVNPVDQADHVTDEGYVGVDPVYQNYANDTDKPLAAEEGPDQAAEDAFHEAYEAEASEGSELLLSNYGAVNREDKEEPKATPAKKTAAPAAAQTTRADDKAGSK
jgi:hypothetical protein